MMRDRVKIFFRIEQDDDGYPGVGSESVWAQRASVGGLFSIDNIPFFATDANFGDLVSVDENDGVLWFRGVVHEAPCSLMRVVFFDADEKDRIYRALMDAGCRAEYWDERKLLAVSVPNETVSRVEALLDREVENGVLDYEEPILRGAGD